MYKCPIVAPPLIANNQALSIASGTCKILKPWPKNGSGFRGVLFHSLVWCDSDWTYILLTNPFQCSVFKTCVKNLIKIWLGGVYESFCIWNIKVFFFTILNKTKYLDQFGDSVDILYVPCILPLVNIESGNTETLFLRHLQVSCATKNWRLNLKHGEDFHEMNHLLILVGLHADMGQ